MAHLACASLLGLLLLAHCDDASAGELRWERLEAVEKPVVVDSSILFGFRFVNPGEDIVQIDSVKTACGCTAVDVAVACEAVDAELHTTVAEEGVSDAVGGLVLPVRVPPRATGEVHVRFSVGVRRGVQRKPVVIRTSVPGNLNSTRVATLWIEAHIPESIQLETDRLVWDEAEPLNAKFLAVTVPAAVLDAARDSGHLIGGDVIDTPLEFAILSARSTCPRTIASVVAAKEPGRYVVSVTPRKGSSGEIVLESNYRIPGSPTPYEVLVPFEVRSEASGPEGVNRLGTLVRTVGPGCGG